MDRTPSSASPEDLQFADLVVSQGLCAREKVDECLSFIARLREQGVAPVPRLGELLVRRGLLSAAHDATLRPTTGIAPAPGLPGEAAAAAREPANVLGKYVRTVRLGAGGMGEVWKGWDCELHRWVALKFLHQSDPAQEARFRREARTAAALSHPHIASVFEVGAKDGKPFIAMQYVQGPTLAAFPGTDRRVLAGLVRDAALAVHHAHGLGVVHRDLKPANLMVEDGRVFVMDFGLAKATSVDASLSVSGSVVGTPAYMPPEQARGSATAVDARADVYSLGATLYELLAGRPPFQGGDVYAVLRDVIDRDPEPPRRLRPSIERDLETIVLKCLEKQPERRYGTALELAEDLDRWLRGESILAHPPSVLYRARKFVGRRKALVAIGAGGLAAVAVTLALLVPTGLRERTLKELGPLRTQIAVVREWVRQPFRKPDEIRRAFQAEIDGVSAYVARHPEIPQGPYVRAYARLHLGDLAGAERDVRESLRLDPEFLPAWSLLGRVQLETYAGLLSAEKVDPFKVREDQARKALEEARDSLRRGGRTGVEAWGLARTRDDAVGETLAEALHLHYVQGATDRALRTLDEAHRRAPSEEFRLWTARWTPPGEEKDRRIRETLEIAPLWAPAHVERGNALANDGRSAEAVAAYTDALARDPRSIAALTARGLVRGETRDLKGAIDDFTEVLRIDPRDTLALVYRGAARAMSGDPDGAIADCGKALEIHPTSVGAFINRSNARSDKGDPEGALADLDRVLAINPKVPHAWSNRAHLALLRKDTARALEDITRAIEVDATFWDAWKVRGILRRETGDLAGSISDLTRAMELVPERRSPAYRSLLYGERCMSRLTKGDLDGGLGDAREALRLQPESAAAHFWHGSALLARGDAEGAIAAYGRAVEREPKYADAWNGRAQARLARGPMVEVEADATRALEIDPSHVAALLVRAHARASLGRFPDAAADAEKAHGLLPAASPQKGLARKWAEAFRAGKRP